MWWPTRWMGSWFPWPALTPPPPPDMPRCAMSDRGDTVELTVQAPAWCDPDSIEIRVEPLAVHLQARTFKQVERDRPPLFHRQSQSWSHRVTLPSPVLPHLTERKRTGRTLHIILHKTRG
ncbi:MAG: Hsp20/alpha crystallin family protein [Kyrpidia sp.]|nr:Hsp20/alpha crystallin family protein [Kyrpidia sp.]